ncbi:macrolide family glycosyltransferase [Saccharopolyspora sp. 7B]|uniref:macrolide family glycosyltransferase n=1 Tax=Saccharopolyspora sp. 7B TaxID=2877240 RepID=UPI001CD55A0F|nr:macrolide family glycosyltransferase [Saccharopolyspora sp. 7B]MCA1280427.1 glycosyl transferase [Saccharopolyspora sp. 7B]
MSKHFAFVSMTAHGHVNPTLPLVEELVRRGHRVTYAIGPEFHDAVQAAGATLFDTGTVMPEMPTNFAKFTPEAMAPMLEFRIEDIQRSFPKLVEHFRQDLPDAVCFDQAEATGPMLAEKLGVPEVSLIPHFAGNEHFLMRDVMVKKDDENPFDPNHPIVQDFAKRMKELTTEFGVTFDPSSFGQAKPSPLNLVFLPKKFQLRSETFDDRFEFIGPSVGQRGIVDWKPKHGDKPLLFISLGTVFNQRPEFFRLCIEAFRDSGWQVAMSIGKVVQEANLGEIPENFEVRTSFPQPAVLQHATAFLTHTGMNSTMETLYYGVPPIAFPQMPEQEANADRAQELGLGKRLQADDVTPELLRATVDEVAADEQIRANLAEMREAVLTSGGAPAGADALERFLS